jgi:uncharacterized glyoxalase superfamily protein PhnB
VNASETRAVSPIPDRLRTVTPSLVVRDGAAAIDFYGRAFGAEELGDRFTGPNAELIHAEIQIGDSVVTGPSTPRRARLTAAASRAKSAATLT